MEEVDGFEWDLQDSQFGTSPDSENLSLSSKDNQTCVDDEFAYLPGTEEFRKARKRRQNRESASRNRAKKRSEVADLELELHRLEQDHQALKLENAALRSENEYLKGSSVSPLPIKKPKRSVDRVLTICILVSVVCLCVLTRSDEGGRVMEGRSPLAKKMEFESWGSVWVGVLAMVGMGLGWWWSRKNKITRVI